MKKIGTGSITFIAAFIISAVGVVVSGLRGGFATFSVVSVAAWFGVLAACLLFSFFCAVVANWLASADAVNEVRAAHPEWYMSQLGVDQDVIEAARDQLTMERSSAGTDSRSAGSEDSKEAK